MRINKFFLATAVAGLFATPVFAQASPAKPATKKEVKAETKTLKKVEKAEAKKDDHAEHMAFAKATAAPKKWLAAVPKLTKTEKTQINTIEKKYNTQIATMRKDHLAAEKAGTETDVGLAAKVQAVVDQERAELRAALTADQQAKFDANVSKIK